MAAKVQRVHNQEILAIPGASEFFLVQMAAKAQRVQNNRILPIHDAREFFLIQDGGQSTESTES